MSSEPPKMTLSASASEFKPSVTSFPFAPAVPPVPNSVPQYQPYYPSYDHYSYCEPLEAEYSHYSDYAPNYTTYFDSSWESAPSLSRDPLRYNYSDYYEETMSISDVFDEGVDIPSGEIAVTNEDDLRSLDPFEQLGLPLFKLKLPGNEEKTKITFVERKVCTKSADESVTEADAVPKEDTTQEFTPERLQMSEKAESNDMLSNQSERFESEVNQTIAKEPVLASYAAILSRTAPSQTAKTEVSGLHQKESNPLLPAPSPTQPSYASILQRTEQQQSRRMAPAPATSEPRSAAHSQPVQPRSTQGEVQASSAASQRGILRLPHDMMPRRLPERPAEKWRAALSPLFNKPEEVVHMSKRQRFKRNPTLAELITPMKSSGEVTPKKVQPKASDIPQHNAATKKNEVLRLKPKNLSVLKREIREGEEMVYKTSLAEEGKDYSEMVEKLVQERKEVIKQQAKEMKIAVRVMGEREKRDHILRHIPIPTNRPLMREYVKQFPSRAFDALLVEQLQTLTRFQDRQKERDPTNFKAKKRYVCGLKESLRVVEVKKARYIVLATNIEAHPSGGSTLGFIVTTITVILDGLDRRINELLAKAHENDIPIIYSMSCSRLGKAVNRNAKVSAVAVKNPDGVLSPVKFTRVMLAGTDFKTLLRQAKLLRYIADVQKAAHICSSCEYQLCSRERIKGREMKDPENDDSEDEVLRKRLERAKGDYEEALVAIAKVELKLSQSRVGKTPPQQSHDSWTYGFLSFCFRLLFERDCAIRERAVPAQA